MIRMPVRLAALLGAALLVSSVAQAQLFRTYLSASGSDANPCTLPAPCRLLPAALNAVASGGEIWMLDSANYNVGSVPVTKSVTILAVPGTVGSLISQGPPALLIETPDVDVALRNIVLVGMPGAAFARGITMTAGNTLQLDGCKLSGFAGHAVDVYAAARITVSDTAFSLNAIALRIRGRASMTVARSTFFRNTDVAILVLADVGSTPSTQANVIDSTFADNYVGIHAWVTVPDGKAEVFARSSLFSGHVVTVASSVTGGPAFGGARSLASVANSSITGSSNSAMQASGPGARVLATGNTISGNYFGFNCADQTLCVRGGNYLYDNQVTQFGPPLSFGGISTD